MKERRLSSRNSNLRKKATMKLDATKGKGGGGLAYGPGVL